MKRIKDFEIEKWNGKKIIIFGCGIRGKEIGQELQKRNIENFCFCDSYKTGKDLLDKPVVGLDAINQNTDVNFIIGSTKYCIEIYDTLIDSGIKEEAIYTAAKILEERAPKLEGYQFDIPPKLIYRMNYLKLNAYINDGWVLEYLDTIITEICTLKCKACSSLMPQYKNPRNCDRNVVLQSFDNLLHSNCYIKTVKLLGGEPLVNQDFVQEMLIRYKDEAQIGCFQIITNGTIVPNEETLRAMRENGRCYVIFSNYGELSRKQEEAIKALEEYGIESVVERDEDITITNNTKWIDYGEVKHYQFPKEKHQKMFDTCRDKECTTLMNGRLFFCPRIAHGVALKLIPEDLPRNSINMLDEALTGVDWREIKKECIEFISNEQYLPACEYCNRNDNILIERAKQVEKQYDKA